MIQSKPKISVFIACKNGGRFLRETVNSIFNQTFQDFEIVLVDGASTDNTLEILEEYKDEPRLRWISEPDNDAIEGYYKALMMTRGEYVMIGCVSDGYLSRNWFQKCVDVLDNDCEVSLVYGLPQVMMEDGSLGQVVFSEFFTHPPPQKMEFFPYWLATFFQYPEPDCCVRGEIFKKMYPKADSNDFFEKWGPFKKFTYNLITSGYLVYFLPIVACYTMEHKDSRNNSKRFQEINKRTDTQYISDIIKYRDDVFSGRTKHIFRDGQSNVVKTIEPHELRAYRRKVLGYRVTRNNYVGYRDKLNLNYWQAKAGLGKIKGKIKKGILKVTKISV